MKSDTVIENPKPQPGGLMPWLRLLRITALPTAISNILMAFLLVHQTWTPTVELALLIFASSCLYLAGMVLNDVFDFDIDLKQRPNRPLPSGQISRSTARMVGFGLLIGGVLIACIAGWIGGATGEIGLDTSRTGAIAILLAVSIVLYDGPLKQTIVAPVLMGGCRTLNILLGASTFIPFAVGLETEPTVGLFLGLPFVVWWVALAIGTLITGATLLGRKEAVENQGRMQLVIGGILIVAGLIGLALVVYCPTSFEISDRIKGMFPLFIGIISLTILRRVVEAVIVAKPKQIQAGVVSVLRSLIVLDAGICYLAVPDHLGYAFAVLGLLVPTLLLSRYVSST